MQPDFFQQEDPDRALNLLREAQGIDSAQPGKYTRAIATIYAAAEIALLRPDGHVSVDLVEPSPEVASKLDAELQSSDDPALLSRVGSMLASVNVGNRPNQQQRAFELIQKGSERQSMKNVTNRCSRCQTNPRSFLSQCSHGIFPRGTASGNVSGEQGHGRENTSCQKHRCCVARR